MIRIGQHLIRDEFGYRLVFEAHEVKTGERYNTMLPESLTPATDRYLAIYRPNITGTCRYETDLALLGAGPRAFVPLTRTDHPRQVCSPNPRGVNRLRDDNLVL